MQPPIVTDQDRTVFNTVSAAPQPPGTITGDFDRLLDFVGAEGIPVSPKTAEFAIASLPTLNAMLTEPAITGLTRGRQVSYPHVDALHLLLRSTRLGKLDRTRSTQRMVLDMDMVSRWRQLNPIERYFTLLDRWWSIADFEEDWTGLKALRMADMRLCLLEFHAPRSKAGDARTDEALRHLLGVRQIALLQMFGMLQVTQGISAPGKGWDITSMKATPWGLASNGSFFRAFGRTPSGRIAHLLDLDDDELAAETPEEEELDDTPQAFLHWAKEVLPCFPALQHVLGAPEVAEPFHGSITLRVSLGKVWRRIAMSADSSFDDLARFILEAFGFDDDHLYQFRYQDVYADHYTLDDPRCSDVDDDFADAVLLGEIDLYPRQVIEFVFDFGANWQFKIEIEALDATAITKPRLLAKEGKAPRQY